MDFRLKLSSPFRIEGHPTKWRCLNEKLISPSFHCLMVNDFCRWFEFSSNHLNRTENIKCHHFHFNCLFLIFFKINKGYLSVFNISYLTQTFLIALKIATSSPKINGKSKWNRNNHIARPFGEIIGKTIAIIDSESFEFGIGLVSTVSTVMTVSSGTRERGREGRGGREIKSDSMANVWASAWVRWQTWLGRCATRTSGSTSGEQSTLKSPWLQKYCKGSRYLIRDTHPIDKHTVGNTNRNNVHLMNVLSPLSPITIRTENGGRRDYTLCLSRVASVGGVRWAYGAILMRGNLWHFQLGQQIFDIIW